jgi:hypothetical protein
MRGAAGLRAEAEARHVRLHEQRVGVRIAVDRENSVPAVRGAVVAMGAKTITIHETSVYADFPVPRLYALSALDGVTAIYIDVPRQAPAEPEN